MARKRTVRQSTETTETGYPSLADHLATRRRFLSVAGASLAAGGLAVACGRAMGHEPGGDASTAPDASHRVDSGPDAPGGDPGPGYYTVRIPVTGELHAYLIDGGSASFYVEAATYALESFEALQGSSGTAGDRARSTLEEFTYDALSSGAGVAAAEDDLLTVLDELVMEQNTHSDPTIVAVTLHITYLDPEPMWMGEAPSPSYP
ncbi:MAG: hypothetical protein ABI333_20365 [bacterium]